MSESSFPSSSSSSTVLPSSHPPIPSSGSDEKSRPSCPVTGKSYEWRPPQDGDRLKACYSLSTPLATFLTFGGFLLLHRVPIFQKLDLHEVGRHGRVEHDASLVHDNTPSGQHYAPIKIENALVDALIADAMDGEDGKVSEGGDPILMDAAGVARARIRREKESKPLDAFHAEVARGEMAIILGVLETRLSADKEKGKAEIAGIPVEWLREWIGHERLPEGWKPTHTQSLLNTMKRSTEIRKAMEAARGKNSEKA
ncbi:hypothetical protein H0H92_000808 [Tricholoma furcatifolium]|nr:hypothetical protein H0H92_000808 [Tricholoma furcatifolium]